jgi:hypothetical protein
VFTAVDFSMNFTIVMPGFEGAAYDCRVVRRVIKQGFNSLGPGYFFFANRGYSAFSRLFLVLYRKIQYYLREWGLINEKPANTKELFNLRHSQMRNMIKRVFGVLKKRFCFVQVSRNSYDLKIQVRIVYAVTALHN